jgi:hypothetical protein
MGSYGDRDEFSQSREINIKNLSWRQRMVETERRRKELQEKLAKSNPTAFLKDPSFKITRKG